MTFNLDDFLRTIEVADRQVERKESLRQSANQSDASIALQWQKNQRDWIDTEIKWAKAGQEVLTLRLQNERLATEVKRFKTLIKRLRFREKQLLRMQRNAKTKQFRWQRQLTDLMSFYFLTDASRSEMVDAWNSLRVLIEEFGLEKQLAEVGFSNQVLNQSRRLQIRLTTEEELQKVDSLIVAIKNEMTKFAARLIADIDRSEQKLEALQNGQFEKAGLI